MVYSEFWRTDLEKFSITSLAHQWMGAIVAKSNYELLMDLILTNMQLFASEDVTVIDGLEMCGLFVDYCNVFISCLDSHSDGTHSLQRTYVLDTIFAVFALFRQKKSLQTQPQHCFASLSNMRAFRSCMNQPFEWFGSIALTHLLLTVTCCHLLAILILHSKYLLLFK